MSDRDLSKKIEDFQALARENPNVNVNLLMASALSEENQKLSEKKSYRWAYLVSLGVPPFGLIYAAKYYLSGDEQDKTAAHICVGLTLVSVLLFYGLTKAIFSSSGASLDQIQQIKPSDIQQLTR